MMDRMTWQVNITGPDGEHITMVEFTEKQIEYLVHYAIINILKEAVKQGEQEIDCLHRDENVV